MIHTNQTTAGNPGADDGLGIRRLDGENREYAGTGGVSRNNRSYGFVPAFLDTVTGKAYRSSFSDGRPAPMHLLDGLPGHLLIRDRDELKARKGVVSGFLHDGGFLTRAEAALALARTTGLHQRLPAL